MCTNEPEGIPQGTDPECSFCRCASGVGPVDGVSQMTALLLYPEALVFITIGVSIILAAVVLNTGRIK